MTVSIRGRLRRSAGTIRPAPIRGVAGRALARGCNDGLVDEAAMPGRTRIPQIIAHRGSSKDLPEHTLKAYLRAIDEGAEALESGQLQCGDGALPVGGPVDIAIVGTDQMRVGREPYVALEGLRAFVDGAQVGLERVLGQVLAGSSVGDDLRDPRAAWHGCFVHKTIVAPAGQSPPGDTPDRRRSNGPRATAKPPANRYGHGYRPRRLTVHGSHLQATER